MDQNKRIIQVLGPIVGFILLYYVFTSMASYLQQGQLALIAEAEATPAAEAAAGAEVATVDAAAPVADTVTDTVAVTATTEVAASTEVTGAGEVAAAAEVTTTTAITAAEIAAAEAVTASEATTTTAATTDAAAAVVTATVEITPEAATGTAATPTATPAPTATPEPTAEAAAPSGPPVATDLVIGAFNKGACTACHVISEIPNAVGQVGPDLSNLGVDAATRVPGQSAVEYIHASIVDPNKFTAPECPFGPCVTGAMPPGLDKLLSPEELDAVVEYLSQQRASP